MVPVDHRERTFEAAIEDSLLTSGGYAKASSADFDRVRCLDPGPLLAFVQQTQPTAWKQIAAFHGARAEAEDGQASAGV